MGRSGRHVVFLLGAGVSFDLLPLSKTINSLVATGEFPHGKVVRHTDDRFYIWPESTNARHFARPSVEDVRTFLTWLGATFRAQSPGLPIDYEVIYFACQQIHDAIFGELDNPLLVPFVREMLSCRSLPEELQITDEASAMTFARVAMNYVGFVVSQALEAPASAAFEERLLRAYAPLVAACRDPEIEWLDVVTLNHDTLAEQCFRLAGIVVEDGFSRQDPTQWAAGFWDEYHDPREPRRLVKLHGSIDWWRVRIPGTDWRTERVVRHRGRPDRLHADGNEWEGLDACPLILVGTFNKILDYTQPFNLTQLAVFRRALLSAETLIVSGYSFRDKGVNGLITGWYYANPRGKIVVLDPGVSPRGLPTARGAIANKWASWTTEGRLLARPVTLDTTAWEELKGWLAPGIS